MVNYLVKERSSLRMKINTKASSKMEEKVDMEKLNTLMDYKMLEEIQNLQNIKVCGNQERDMVKDY
jgi:hypothetical protein